MTLPARLTVGDHDRLTVGDYDRLTVRDNETVICGGCQDRHHDQCRGGSWCDCQHLPGSAVPVRTTEADLPQDGATEPTAKPKPAKPAEPQVNWVRQG